MNPFASIAVWGFWALLIVGIMLDEVRFKAGAILVVLWIAGYLWSRSTPYGVLFISGAAVLDIVLVLIIFKGDVELK